MMCAGRAELTEPPDTHAVVAACAAWRATAARRLSDTVAPPMKTVDVVAACLTRAGADTVFGVVGSGNFTVTTSLQARGARFVAARHENGAVCMADAYARVSGRLGVATVHQGPGLTNAMTGLTEAAKARTPLVMVAADTPASDVRSNFRIDQAGLVESVGAVAERVNGGRTAYADTMRAVRRALAQRRTVLLNLPLDVQDEDAHWPDDGEAPLLPVAPGAAPDAIRAMADAVQAARRPVIIAGRGAVLAGAGDALEALGERTGAVLATSAMGHGLFAGSPWSVGISGGFASPLAAEVIASSDLLLTFGAQLTRWTTRSGELIAPDARVVQVDVDADRLGANDRVDLPVAGDARQTAALLGAELERRGHRSDGMRTVELEATIAARRWRDEPFDDASSARYIDPRALSIALDDLLPRERTVVVDSGHFMGFPPMYLAVPDPAGFVFTQSFQSIGLGLANAIGAALARPDRLTVAALGDGGAMMGLPELDTAARLRLPMLFVIYDDAAYGAEVHHFRPKGHAVDTVQFPDTDFAAIARGLGAEGVTVRTVEDLRAVEEWLGRRDGPLLVDAKVDPDICAEWLEEAFRTH
jgi:thiamine pyrophosphate-dependent acetolactate synthase large subunit-like protein